MENGVVLKGKYFARVYGPDGLMKDEREGQNVVVTNGKEFLASFLNSAAAAASTFTMRYLAVGTNSSAESSSDSDLGSELARVSGVVSYVSNQIYQVTGTFSTGVAEGSVAEYGIFSSSTGGTLLSRDTESTIAVGASDTLQVTYQLTIG